MTKCDSCSSLENPDKCHLFRIGPLKLCLCRKCAGVMCRQLLAYIRDFTRKWPAVKKPRNQELPLGNLEHGYSCRNTSCQIRLPDWQRGDSPYCEECRP